MGTKKRAQSTKQQPIELKVRFERCEGRWLAEITGPGFKSLGDGATKSKALRDAQVGAFHVIALMVERGELNVRSVVVAA